MFKQSPSRNHRSKGIKVKRVLQICVLLAVCFWLVYQVKHSHDKKKEYDENDAKMSHEKHFDGEISKIGRKAILPGLEEATMNNDEVEEETGGEEEENKQHDEEEQEEEDKIEEKEDEGRGGGDDEIDERDQEKSEMGVEHEVDFIDEEKEREEADEKAAENKDVQNENENENSLEDRDHDGSNRNAHEAREEHYRADDASSAVTHETEGGSLENSNKNTEMNSQVEENKANNAEEITVAQNTTGVEAAKGEMAENVVSPNVTRKEEKEYQIGSSKSEDSSPLNSTRTTVANNQPEIGNNNSTEGSSEPNNLSMQNEMETKPDASKDSALQTVALGQENNSNTAASNNHQSDSNLTISSNTENLEAAAKRESSNSSTTSEFSVSEKVTTSNALVEVEGTAEEHSDATRNEKSETSNGTDVKDESRDSAETENADVVHHDPFDSSIPLEKDVRMDLDTLPEIRTEGSNNEDAAAE
ncbi:cilia- and flagella-associated protein 251-like [Camellia sinensis]|uniref:cilia- and flagella-associated protein 251-like n=1 Tax=Camellia sinensis TaxID=4442 RepID=UPI0010359175|nr:cilia- and flagella-associated protein 251-like [Camellia sinensis]